MENNSFKTPEVSSGKPVVATEPKSIEISSGRSTSNLSADELKAAIHNLGGAKEDKNERNVVISGSIKASKESNKPVVKKEEEKQEVQNEAKTETPEEPVKADTEVKTPEVTKDVAPSLQEQVAELVKLKMEEMIGDKTEATIEKEVEEEPMLTAADITPEVLADPGKTSEFIMRAAKQMAKQEAKLAAEEMYRTKIEPFTKQIQPVANKIANDNITNHKAEAESKFPELKTDAKFQKNVKTFIEKNKDLINKWSKDGENPFLKVSQIVKSDNLEVYLKEAREKAVKETEERMKKASGAFAEGGGKPSNVKQTNPDNMSAEELKQLITSSIK